MIPLPANIDAAYSTALAANPDLAAARKTEEASRWAVRVARGQLLPTADIQGTVGHNADSTYRHDHDNSAAIMGQLRIPLYQAGLASSQVRQALQENSRDRLRIAETQRAVIAQITGAWENLRAARAAIRSFREQVRANVIALDGVSQEAQVGSRTVLDVLDAEQELLNSRVNLVQSERNEYLASFQLLSGLGKLQPRTLGVAVQSYDPAAYYDNVRNKWFDPSAYDFNWLAVEPEKAADQSNGNPPAAEPAR
jgi:outer membrane protein